MMALMNVDRLIARVPVVVRAGLVILVLCGLILAMVLERANVLRNGAAVRLATEPVDPRDLFRGDYVILNYEISRLNVTKLAGRASFDRNDIVYVGLRTAADGKAEPVKLVREGEPREAGLVWLQGKAANTVSCDASGPNQEACMETDQIMRVRYGLESYFVPQGEGKVIEQTDKSRVDVIVAVAASGKSAIKSLLIDGKPLYDEPPF